MTRQMKEGGPELPCMTRIKNESANIVNKNGDNERPFFLKIMQIVRFMMK